MAGEDISGAARALLWGLAAHPTVPLGEERKFGNALKR
jgi:hypothetical protein